MMIDFKVVTCKATGDRMLYIPNVYGINHYFVPLA